MPYMNRKSCPICGKRNLKTINTHLSQVHKLNSAERQLWLKKAKCSSWLTEFGECRLSYTEQMFQHTVSHKPKQRKTSAVKQTNNISLKSYLPNVMTTEPYPEFRFRHKFSMLVIAPTQSGKTYFVRQLLEMDHINYDNHKRRRIMWYYGQYQDVYKDMKRSLKRDIHFIEGLPDYENNLSNLDDSYNNIIVLDDLMDLAKDSTIVSKLFTQGRHRNTSVILLLQNAFPKGKCNTEISRNAQYVVLWKCPSDRRQIGMLADRIFEKNKDRFMEVYNKVTAKPYQYVLVDCKPDTHSSKQLIADVFGACIYFPNIYTSVTATNRRKVIEGREPLAQSSLTHINSSINDILRDTEEEGPIVIHLSSQEWSQVITQFKMADGSYNVDPGWKIWRIYLSQHNRDTHSIPVLLKGYGPHSETKLYHVDLDWLKYSCHTVKHLL